MNYEIECKNGTKKLEYWVNCFDRTLTLLFKDTSDDELINIKNELENNYDEWNMDDRGWCCEEFIIKELSSKYKNKIVAVIYEEEI